MTSPTSEDIVTLVLDEMVNHKDEFLDFQRNNKVDYAFWFKHNYWSLDDLCLLMLDINPDLIIGKLIKETGNYIGYYDDFVFLSEQLEGHNLANTIIYFYTAYSDTRRLIMKHETIHDKNFIPIKDAIKTAKRVLENFSLGALCSKAFLPAVDEYLRNEEEDTPLAGGKAPKLNDVVEFIISWSRKNGGSIPSTHDKAFLNEAQKHFAKRAETLRTTLFRDALKDVRATAKNHGLKKAVSGRKSRN